MCIVDARDCTRGGRTSCTATRATYIVASKRKRARIGISFLGRFVRLFVVVRIDKRKSDSSPALYRDIETIAVRVWKVTVVPEWMVSRCLDRKISR